MRLPGRAAGRAPAIAFIIALTTCAFVAGCANAVEPTSVAAPPEGASSTGTVQQASNGAAAQVCRECATGEKPERIEGISRLVGMIQVVEVAIEDGTYVPNAFDVKAGVPVRVLFSGTAKGCLAKPEFRSLGQSADLTDTGQAAVNLGTLDPGVYTFTCGMGMNAGTMTAR